MIARLCVILLLAVVLLLTSCQQAAQKAVEQATGVQVDQKGNQVTIAGKDGEKLVVDSNLPEDMKALPVPDGFKLASGASITQQGNKVSTATWNGKGTFQAIADFYKQAMTKDGWAEQMTAFDTTSGGVLIYTKGDQSLWVSTQEGSSKGEVELTMMLGKAGQQPPGRQN